MSDFFAVEDGDNIGQILHHHLRGELTGDQFQALEMDLLRYCTRLRNQPVTRGHTYKDSTGYVWNVPAHELIRNPSGGR